MQKLYGFKSGDLVALAKAVDKRKNQSLTQIFKEFGAKYNKATGTVRNLYYALIKLSQEDADFTNEHLSGKPLKAGKIERFNAEQERDLLEKVAQGQKDGRSVRSIILEMACGDAKLALRYQNKYRSALRRTKVGLSKTQNGKPNEIDGYQFPKATLLKLKREINALADRLNLSASRENALLKARVEVLERENQKLYGLLTEGSEAKIAKFFTPTGFGHTVH